MATFTGEIMEIKNLLDDPHLLECEDRISNGIIECDKMGRKLNKKLKKTSSIGERNHLTTSIALIKSYRRCFIDKRISGRGLRTTAETAKHRVFWEDIATAFQSRVRTGAIINLKHKDVKNFLIDCKTLFKRRIRNVLKQWEFIKVNTVLTGLFCNNRYDEDVNKHFNTANHQIYRETDLDIWFRDHIEIPILTKLEEFQSHGSGWSLKSITNLQININKFSPLVGSSYLQLPKCIENKKACINVQNNDEACFAWAVVSALYPVEKDSQRISKYPHYSKVLNLKGIQFPITIRQIPRFEKQNNLSLNVYALKKIYNGFDTYPMYLTVEKREKHVNLLLFQNQYRSEEDVVNCVEPIRYHYVWIKNLSRLVSSQLSKHTEKKFFCDRCMHYFYTQEKLHQHAKDCGIQNIGKVRLPDEDKKILAFKNHKNKEKVPFIVYADIESILLPVNDKTKYQQHVPGAIGYYLKCSYDDSLSLYRSYRGEDCADWFAMELKKLSTKISDIFLNPIKIDPLTSKEEIEFQQATLCHICHQPFLTADDKVRDHFHLASGTNNNGGQSNYRGPAHKKCNILYQDSHVIPVVFHNGSKYDSHLILQSVALKIDGHINLLPLNKENYISFTKYVDGSCVQLRFIDSFRFMSSSLEKLVANLGSEQFKIIKKFFPDVELFRLISRKGVYPYDYMSSFEKFNETQLPPIELFYNQLENRGCTRKSYIHAKLVWDKFKIKNLGEYTDLYLKTDVLLLSDVFEQFRTSCLSKYDLDPACYYTLPGYTWDCMLKYTGINLELLTDIDQLLFVEKGIRGGLSQCSKRRVIANNKYMPTYDSSKPDTFLMYLDINNQYGYAQTQYLPYGGFKWVEPLDITSVDDNSTVGYILEVDLEYPKYLHDKHRDIPFCPEHKCAPGSKEKKLLATLENKSRYVIHYRALKQALKHGLILSKVHRVLQFKQRPWLEPYITLNANLRKNAKNDFEKDLYKFMNNAIFGKTIESVRKRCNVKLIQNWGGRYGAEARLSSPLFKSFTIFNENLIGVELCKHETYFNKPIYIGMSILDIAKTTIYDFHYDYMVDIFPNCRIAYTDTDGLVYEINDRDPYQIIKRDCYTKFDTSDYPLNNIYGIPQVNKRAIGLMKDEHSGRIMTDFVGLRAKSYINKVLQDANDLKRKRDQLEESGQGPDEMDAALLNVGITKKAKGVKKSVVQNEILFDDYTECLENLVEKTVDQNLIRAEKHSVFSVVQRKIALSPYDDKRFLIPNSYDTLPWGHYSIE